MTVKNTLPGVGIEVAPRWRIVSTPSDDESDEIQLVIDPGPGFGDGTHETTQLCLQALAASLAPSSASFHHARPR